MQTHGGAAADAAITSPERVIRASVQVDWDGDGNYAHPMSNLDPYIENVKLSKALQGSAPEEIILVEGSSVAELTLTMSGEFEGVSLANLFSPYNSNGAFYGKQVVDREIKYTLKVETTSGLVEYPQFVGNIRTISPDRGEDSVEITALDRAEKMRKPIQLPPWAASQLAIVQGKQDSQHVRSEWVIDHALRLCDAGPSDKRPAYREEENLAPDALDGVQLYITGNGSFLPTKGYCDSGISITYPPAGQKMYDKCGRKHPKAPSNARRPNCLYGLGLPLNGNANNVNNKGILRYWVNDQDQLNPPSTHYIGFTLCTNGDNGNAFTSIGNHVLAELFIGMGRAWEIWVGGGKLWTRRVRYSGASLTVEATSSQVTIPTGQDNVDCFIMWDATPSTGSKVYVRAGTNSIGWSTFGSPITSGSDVAADELKGRFSLGTGLNLADIVYATRNTGGRPVNDTSQCYKEPKYLAILDEGLNKFTYMPNSKKQEAWALIQAVAAAEWGSCFWDEEGVFRFWNWKTMIEKRLEIVRTFSMDDVTGFRMTNSTDSVRNVLAVKTTKKRAGSVQNVVTSSDANQFYTPARTEARFVVWADNVVSVNPKFLSKYDTEETNEAAKNLWPSWSDAVHGYCLQYYKPFQGNLLWQEDPYDGDIEVRAYWSTDGYITVRVNNDYQYPIRFASGAGDTSQPAFNLAGTPIVEDGTSVIMYRDDESIRKYGARVLELSGDWYQDTAEINQMFETLIKRTANPTPATDAITVAGDPRIQMADVVQIADRQGFGEEINLQILGLDREFDIDTGLTDTYTVEIVPPPGEEPPVDPEEPVYRTRRNLCPNPSAANNAKDFYQGSGRVTGVTGMPRTTAYQAGVGGGISLPKTDVQWGKTYKMSCYIKSPSANQNGECHIDWYSWWGYLGSAPNKAWSVSSGQVIRADAPAATAPLGATRGFLVVASHDATIQIGGILYEEGTALNPYFDGDSPGAVWDGAQGNSQSRITEQIN